MDDKQSARIFGSTAIAVFAGVVGSVLTLVLSSHIAELSPVVAEAPPASPTLQAGEIVLTDSKAAAETELIHAELREALADASAERSQLAKVLADVTRQIEFLESELADAQSEAANGDEILPAGSEALPLTAESFARANRAAQPNAERTVQNLVAAGLDSQTAGDIQARRDQYQLARLELFDTATREGWIDSDEFGERLSALDEERIDLRDELGDSAYDQYLYESGSNNRVGIDSVINGSAAQIAGLQTGDLVISYADERVFRSRELQSATRAGTRGEYVQVTFERAGQYMSADVPRGPLGVTLRGSSVEP